MYPSQSQHEDGVDPSIQNYRLMIGWFEIEMAKGIALRSFLLGSELKIRDSLLTIRLVIWFWGVPK